MFNMFQVPFGSFHRARDTVPLKSVRISLLGVAFTTSCPPFYNFLSLSLFISVYVSEINHKSWPQFPPPPPHTHLSLLAEVQTVQTQGEK